MSTEFPIVGKIISLFNLQTKKDVERYCADLVIDLTSLSIIISAGKDGMLSPYRYANHFHYAIPEHLNPNSQELQSMDTGKVGPFTGKQRKLFRKYFQTLEEKRDLCFHLFYTEDLMYWHLFYFGHKDISDVNNHWAYGPHIHFVNSLWEINNLESVWNDVLAGNRGFPSVHIRYENRVLH